MEFKKAFLWRFSLIAIVALSSAQCEDEGGTNPVNTGPVVYDPTIKNLMTNYCISCHSGSSASAGLSLSNYQEVRSAVESGTLLSRINNSSKPMPPSGLMSSSERNSVTQWEQDGFPR